MPSLMDTLTADDLPNDVLQYVAETCGIEVARALLRHCPGMRIEIPMKPQREVAKRYIETHWNGKNVGSLAGTLGMSRSFVYKVLSEKSAMRSAQA